MTAEYRWFILAGVFFTGWIVYLLSPILSPFLTAALLAYLGDPIVDFFERHKLSRTAGVGIVFTIFTVVIVIVLTVLIPLLGQQLDIVIQKAPIVIEWVQTQAIPWISGHLGSTSSDGSGLERLREALLSNWQNATGVATQIIKTITSSSLQLLAWIGNLVLIPVVAFYLLRDWDIMIAEIDSLLPRHIQPKCELLAKQCDAVIGQFLRGQLMVMLSLGLIYSIGLAIVGLDVALIVGMLAGMASVVPYLGTIIGIFAATVAALVQHQGELASLIPVFIVFGIGQAIEGWVLTPLLVGDKIGLHPVAVIFAVLAGGQLFGFVGILLALPIAAIIVVLIRHANDHYRTSAFYGAEASKPDEGDIVHES